MLSVKVLTTLLALVAVTAHPGENHHAEALERRASLAMMGKRSLSHCTDKLAARGVHARNNIRRNAIHQQLSKRVAWKRDIDIDSVLNTTHHSNLTGITPSTNSSEIFAGTNQCILAPEVTQGPYYVTGEYFRQNVTESELGVSLYLDIQVIDTNSCEPLPNVALDFWHCNASGVYSGVAASGNGDGSDSNLNNTFLRGIQSTDSEGVAQFISIFPGHYSGRTNHIHILAHTEGNWKLLANNTITGGETAAHVGQCFMDQSLISEVEAIEPYASNTQSHTLNSEDDIMAEEATGFDPVIEYVLLGDTVADGIFAWISVGINSTASQTVQPAAYYGENGGVENANGGMGGGPPGGSGGPGGGNGTAPPGGGPNGTASANTTGTSVHDTNGTASSNSTGGTSGCLRSEPSLGSSVLHASVGLAFAIMGRMLA